MKNLLRYVSNNNRLEILSAFLERGFLRFTELQELTKIKPSPLTFHLRILMSGELVDRGKMNGQDGYFLTDWGTTVLDYVYLIATRTKRDEKAPEVAKKWAIAVSSKLKIGERKKKIEELTTTELVS